MCQKLLPLTCNVQNVFFCPNLTCWRLRCTLDPRTTRGIEYRSLHNFPICGLAILLYLYVLPPQNPNQAFSQPYIILNPKPSNASAAEAEHIYTKLRTVPVGDRGPMSFDPTTLFRDKGFRFQSFQKQRYTCNTNQFSVIQPLIGRQPIKL